jgi:hypothetical protein
MWRPRGDPYDETGQLTDVDDAAALAIAIESTLNRFL